MSARDRICIPIELVCCESQVNIQSEYLKPKVFWEANLKLN